MAERIKMKIKSKNFRVRPGARVKLKEWPTTVKPFGEVFKDTQIDYATEKKIFGHVAIAPYRFLTKVREIKRKSRIGNPDMARATTCHCERMNLSVRQFTRRFNRATLGYSKTLANLRHAVALFTAHFNFCRIHSAHKQTPAQAAMLTKDAWTVERLLEECGKY